MRTDKRTPPPDVAPHLPKKRKMADVLASRIEAEIVSMGWPVGHVLGAEPELLAKYGVSRAIFREAVRILEHHMVATMKRGPGGGLVVTAPDGSAVASSVALYLEYRRVGREALYEARRVLELACVRLLAGGSNAEQRQHLWRILEEEAAASPNVFHLELARLTGNDPLFVFVETLTRLSQVDMERTQCDAHLAHVRIVEAIEAGNIDLAVSRMGRHLDAVSEFYTPTY